MAFLHELATGMGGVRTAGDLVARVMSSKAMRIEEAKKYVADKLKVSVMDLSDSQAMREVREELNIGHVLARPGAAIGIEAKVRIEQILGININSVSKFKKKIGLI
jgi:dimethylamine--corrinoid protein Co-methyltransferase